MTEPPDLGESLWRWPRFIAATLAVTVLIAYALLLVLAFLGQRRIMYPAPVPRHLPPRAPGRLIVIEHDVLRHIHVYHVPARGHHPTVAVFHGNAEQLSDQVDLAGLFAEAGLGMFAVEYPGYGLSSDSQMTEQNAYLASETALKYLVTELQVPDDRLVLFGRSLGTGIAAEMALRGYGSRLILVSPPTSMRDMAHRVLPILPTRWLVLDRYDTLDKAPRIRQPTLVIHGERDNVVPASMGRAIAQSVSGATMHVVANADHNDVFYVGGDLLAQRIVGFAAGEAR